MAFPLVPVLIGSLVVWVIEGCSKAPKMTVAHPYTPHHADGELIETMSGAYPFDSIDKAAMTAANMISEMYGGAKKLEKNTIEYGITIFEKGGKYYLTKMRQGNKICPQCRKCRLKNCSCNDRCTCNSKDLAELSVRIDREPIPQNANGYNFVGFVHSHPPLEYTSRRGQQLFSPDDLAYALGEPRIAGGSVHDPAVFYLVVRPESKWTLLKFTPPEVDKNIYNFGKVKSFYEQAVRIRFNDRTINDMDLIRFSGESFARFRTELLLGDDNQRMARFARNMLICMDCVQKTDIVNNAGNINWDYYHSYDNREVGLTGVGSILNYCAQSPCRITERVRSGNCVLNNPETSEAVRILLG